MSRSAVSGDDFVRLAHLDEVSLPSTPSSTRLMTLRWRSLSGWSLIASQKRALRRTPESVSSAPSIARSRAAEKPFQPYGDVEMALLRGFQDVVVGVALLPELRGHAVEALRALFRTRERHVRDGARHVPVAVIERMDGDESQMRQRRLQNGIEHGLIVEPLQKK